MSENSTPFLEERVRLFNELKGTIKIILSKNQQKSIRRREFLDNQFCIWLSTQLGLPYSTSQVLYQQVFEMKNLPNLVAVIRHNNVVLLDKTLSKEELWINELKKQIPPIILQALKEDVLTDSDKLQQIIDSLQSIATSSTSLDVSYDEEQYKQVQQQFKRLQLENVLLKKQVTELKKVKEEKRAFTLKMKKLMEEISKEGQNLENLVEQLKEEEEESGKE